MKTPPDTTMNIRYDTGFVMRRNTHVFAPLPVDTLYENKYGLVITNEWGDTLMLEKIPDVPFKPLAPYVPQKTAFDSVQPHEPLAPLPATQTAAEKYSSLIEIRPKEPELYPDNVMGWSIAFVIILVTSIVHLAVIIDHVRQTDIAVRRSRHSVGRMPNSKN